MRGLHDEQTPLLAACREQAPEPGTSRFPFHPESRSTPWWRKLCFELFGDAGDAAAVQLSDLWELPRDLRSSDTADELQRCLAACGRRLFRAVWRMDAGRLSKSVVLALGAMALWVVYPVLLYRMLNLVVLEERAELLSIAVHALLMFLALTGHRVLLCHSQAQTSRVAARVGSGLRVMMLREILLHGARRSQDSSQHPSQPTQRLGELAMLYEDDYRAVCELIFNTNLSWTAAIGLAVDVGMIVFLVGVPWQILFFDGVLFGAVWAAEEWGRSRATASWRQQVVRRLNVTHECFRGIQNVKLNAWEDKMQQKIEHARHEEMRFFRRLL
ncbi:hypothetical protein ATCC90586_010650 [Pythium insidiosum]|nr:hypothetical protein ATCC90586_010650 [Pythium insidiosum]